jgi:hypothetical protein
VRDLGRGATTPGTRKDARTKTLPGDAAPTPALTDVELLAAIRRDLALAWTGIDQYGGPFVDRSLAAGFRVCRLPAMRWFRYRR